MSLIEIITKEIDIGKIIFNEVEKNTANCLSKTNKLFNDILKINMEKHYYEYANNFILDKFEELATKKMFSNDTDDENNIKKMIEDEHMKIVAMINDKNREFILDKMIEKHNDYMVDAEITRGNMSNMYYYMRNEYEIFIKNVFDYDVILFWEEL